MKTTLIATVLNEEKNIDNFFKSLFSQTIIPDEFVIVDGGSTDQTIEKILKQIKRNRKKITIKLFVKKGNRSIGRNYAIKKASNEIIICTDFGCILDKNWTKKITQPFFDKNIDVVSGYNKGLASNIFEKSLIPYVLVMEDKIVPDKYLPATRSMGFRKKVWKKIKGFNEKFSNNEDYDFAKKIEKFKFKKTFARDAVVYWKPRSSINQAFIMFYRFAYGDAEARIIRPKAIFILIRYFLGLYLIFISLLERSWEGILISLILPVFYLFWSIIKNYKYVKDRKAIFILPSLQIVSDIAVIIGTIVGLLKITSRRNFWAIIKDNKFLFFLVLLYLVVNLLTIGYGIPNKHHPFPYHMDEWHQLQAVRSTFAYGTPNVEGSANGTMLHFILSGLYLVPSTLLKIINPFELKINDLMARENIFILLRINTIIWGIFSILTIHKIADLIKVSKRISVTLFTLTPIWLMLSGFFKYDIALMFWILFSILLILRFYKKPTSVNFLVAGVSVGFALAVKISVLPLIPIYMLSYFFFQPSPLKNLKNLLFGIIGLFFTAIIFGFPDTLFGTGNIYKYFYENLVTFPQATENIRTGASVFIYVFVRHYAIIFGIGLMFLFIASLIFWFYTFFRYGIKNLLKNYRIESFVFISFFLFLSSLLTLGAYAGGNRALVLLPFFVLIVSLALKESEKLNRFSLFLKLILFFSIITQFYFSLAWINTKRQSIQDTSSKWIEENVQDGTVIGLENIPIYQSIPDILQKEFYFNEYGLGQANRYRYQIVGPKSLKLPHVIVVTNARVEGEILYKSPKEALVKRIEKEGYRKMIFKKETKWLMVSDKNYTVAGLDASPITITVYIK